MNWNNIFHRKKAIWNRNKFEVSFLGKNWEWLRDFGSIIFGKYRHRLADASFEKQLMLKFNKKFWGKLKIQNKCDFCNREFYIILSL